MRCPRCAETVRQRFYGPCVSCRDQLAATMTLKGASPVEASAFVPKSHVVANHVATKD